MSRFFSAKHPTVRPLLTGQILYIFFAFVFLFLPLPATYGFVGSSVRTFPTEVCGCPLKPKKLLLVFLLHPTHTHEKIAFTSRSLRGLPAITGSETQRNESTLILSLGAKRRSTYWRNNTSACAEGPLVPLFASRAGWPSLWGRFQSSV